MAKQGQHKNDAEHGSKPGGHEKSKGHNNPSQSQTITTGSYKKQETYAQKARAGENPEPHAPQGAKNTWNEDLRDTPTTENSPRARDSDIGSGRSGSDSNASSQTRGH
jgi:hypothetical protein